MRGQGNCYKIICISYIIYISRDSGIQGFRDSGFRIQEIQEIQDSINSRFKITPRSGKF